jgi:hypothetical protein
LVISIYPCTRVNDLKKALKEAQEKLPQFSDYDLITPKEYFAKAKPMIRYHREAYWMKKLNPSMKYKEMADDFYEKHISSLCDERVVEKAVETYRKWLNQ